MNVDMQVEKTSCRNQSFFGVLRLVVALFILNLAAIAAYKSVSSAVATDEGFLNAPVYDLARTKNATPSNSEHTRVGDKITLEIPQFQAGPDIQVDIPENKDLEESGWVLQSGHSYPIVAAPLKAGALSLPPLGLKDKNGKWIARTSPFSLNIDSAIKSDDPKAQQPEDLEPPAEIPFPLWVVVLITLLGILIVSVVIFGLVRLYRKRKRKDLRSQDSELPEDQVAIRDLNLLAQRDYLSRREFKVFYFTLSEILKTYLGRRFAFDASESTSGEIIWKVKEKKWVSEDLLRRFSVCFDALDLVKFTDRIPPAAEGEELLAEVKALVQATRRVPAILSETGVAKNAVQ